MSTFPLGSSPRCIALAGDWHGHSGYAVAAIHHAAGKGAAGVVQLGDFGIWPGLEGRLYLNAIEQALAETGLWCAFLDGNHEDFWQLYSLPVGEHGLRQVRERLWHLPRGFRWNWHGKTWMAMGGAVSLDRKLRILGRSWWPEETITTQELEAALDSGPADVMVTHDAPDNLVIPGLLPDAFWDAELLSQAHAHQRMMKAIADAVQPKWLWHGHFHVRYTQQVKFRGAPCTVTGLADHTFGLIQTMQMVELDQL